MGVIAPRDQVKLAALADIAHAAQHIYALTEQFAAARSLEDRIAQQIKHRYGWFKRNLTTAGFDQVAQLAGSMATAAGRPGSQRMKARILREGMSSIRHQLDMEERLIRKSSADEASERKEKKEKAAGEQL